MQLFKSLLPIILTLLLTIYYLCLPELSRCRIPGRDELAEHTPRRRELAVLGAICLIYALTAFIGLGDTSAPESFRSMQGRSALISIRGDAVPAKLSVYTGIGIGSYQLEYSEDGIEYEQAASIEQTHADVLRWTMLDVVTACRPRYLRITGSGNVYLGEVALSDADGAILPISCDVPELCDEQGKVPEEMSYLNSTYFDEIYHARTAWENLNGVYPYEVSHPPLGKLILSLGISLLGMTPFGWRFMGTLLGVLMLPIMYYLAKKLFLSATVAAGCTAVFAADFMHFVQTRIATIDTYSVFFILLMYLFMYLFISEGKLRYLALCGIAFGLGAASKWTSIYAGAGLAVIWAAWWVANRARGFRAFARNSAFCVLFFVLIPFLIYYVSYYPYAAASGLAGIRAFFTPEYADIFASNQSFMFSYHSALVAEHPYSSNWYQWILDIRPILYYLRYYEDATRSSFGAFVNPALCWGGLLALFALIYEAVFRKDKKAAFIVVGYLAQLVPWMFITRLTFEYHYFPCTVFLVLAMGYMFDLFRLNNKRWKLYIYAFAAGCAALFIMFYPALSGLRVNSEAATKLLGWLPTWPF